MSPESEESEAGGMTAMEKLIARSVILGLLVIGYFVLLVTSNPAAGQVQDWLVPLLMAYFAGESVVRLVANGKQK